MGSIKSSWRKKIVDKIKVPNIVEEMEKHGVSKELIDKQKLFRDTLNVLSDYISEEGYKTHPSAVLVKIEPVIVKEGFPMFANRVPSPVINQLTVKTALIDPENTQEYKPGKTIFKTYITESALASAIVGTNASAYPATIVEAMGDSVEKTDYVVDDGFSKNMEMFNKSKNDTLVQIQGALDSVEAVLSEKGAKLGKKEAKELIQTISCATKNIYANTNYHISNSVETYQKDYGSIVVEADNLIKRLSIYSNMKNVDTLLLGDKKGSVKNPMELMLGGLHTVDDLKEIQEKIPVLDFKSYEMRDELKRYNEFVNRYDNKHIVEKISNQNEANACFRFSRIASTDSLSFSSSATSGGEQMQLEINNARMEKNKYGDGENIVEDGIIARIQMSPNDFLMLIRGHSESDFVPCEMSSFCGHLIKKEKISETKDEKVAKNHKVDVSEAVSGLCSKLISLIENGIKTEKAKVEIEAVKNDYLAALSSDLEDMAVVFEKANGETMEIVKKQCHETMEKLNSVSGGQLGNVKKIFKLEDKGE